MMIHTVSDEKWTQHLERAYRHNISVTRTTGTDDYQNWIATSSNGSDTYLLRVKGSAAGVDVVCSCKAQAACKHEALVLERLGFIPSPVPQSAALAAAAAISNPYAIYE